MQIHLLSLFFFFQFAFSTPFSANASFVSKSSATPISSENRKHLKLVDYINLNYDDLEALSGKRMTIWDKASFKILKLAMKKELKTQPDMLVSEYYYKTVQKRLAWGWWVLITLGSLLLLFVILALIDLVSEYGWGNIF